MSFGKRNSNSRCIKILQNHLIIFAIILYHLIIFAIILLSLIAEFYHKTQKTAAASGEIAAVLSFMLSSTFCKP